MAYAQKMICDAFGYEAPLSPISEIYKGIKKKDESHIHIIDNNESLPCAMCGTVHNKGYQSDISASHLIKSMLPATFNGCYDLSQTNFICEYCGFSIVSYGSPAKMKGTGRKMVNVLVTSESKREEKHFSSDVNNELYGILKNPPKVPFVILINSRGKVLENLVYSARSTISHRQIVVNYGTENMIVDPDEVFRCLEDAEVISKSYDVAITSDLIFNRANSVTIKLPRALRENSMFLNSISRFMADYSRHTRVVSKMVLAAWMADNERVQKEPEAQPDKASNAGASLFDF